MVYETEYYKILKKAIKEHGGLFNAHLHLDRADTLSPKYLAHVGINPLKAASLPLKVKQSLTGDLHNGPAYEKEDLERRMRNMLNAMIKIGTRRADSFIDTTADRVGHTALDIALKLKEEYKNKIDFRVGAYPIFGFKNSEPQRWEIFVEGAKKADYIGTLPERDELPGHIGFNEHFRRVLKLAIELKKPVHMHVDQANDPRECGTETLVEAVKWLGSPKIEGETGPTVWGVHSISPSTYDEPRFRRLNENLNRYNIGIIGAPTAAASMRQLRPIYTPTHNCVARILDYSKEGNPIRLGCDNICDIFLPSTTPSLIDELHSLTNNIRFYSPDILAKLVCGKPLTLVDINTIEQSLNDDMEVYNKIDPNYNYK